MVAGEASGDILGAGLMESLLARFPNAQFRGIGGPLMIEQGFKSLFPQERLAVMGIVEPLKRLPELLSIRRSLRQDAIQNPPSVFIGIDSPDFNLDLELKLREAGIATVHYVSPSVWAWRQGRVHKIAKAVDRMLTLLPFEAAFYKQHDVPVTFVGHPLADQIAMEPDVVSARQVLGIDLQAQVVALLPGSRSGEVKLLAPDFIEAAKLCFQVNPHLQFMIPAANGARYAQLEALIEDYRGTLPITLVDGQSKTVMAAADAVLMASGTTTLEAMLLKKPMVVAYRMAWLSAVILSRMVKTQFISLPNLLAGEGLVPEVLQKEVTPKRLADEVLKYFQHPESVETITQRFYDMHIHLKQGASEKAAEAVIDVIQSKSLS
ncbi:lipid-A-disaccharide synthase [Marinibactrum halimedae]|nr:lipid-A-disaccharide synthase [Marinibactrum halimedae]MCD9457584.1 lipid-A-disaccharide synthase [Marinibactrum halimedae]